MLLLFSLSSKYLSKLFAFVVCEHVAPETLLFVTLLGHKVQSPKQHGPSKLSIIIPCFYGAEGFFCQGFLFNRPHF